MDEKTLDIFEAMQEIFETTQNNLLLVCNDHLYSNLRNKNWRDIQLSSKELSSLKHDLSNRAKKLLASINSSTQKAFEIAGIKEPKSIIAANKQGIGLLVGSARKYYKDSVSKIWRLSSADKLHEDILSQVRKGFDQGLRITKNGKSYEYKSYMQMKIRSNIARETTDQVMDLNLITKNVFFIVNSFQDCAIDHKNLQGKIYYDKRFESFGLPKETIEICKKIIKDKNLMSQQDAIEKPFWLTTRPNCRHTFTPITIEQASGNASELLKRMKLSLGTYKDKKYEQSQQLRYIERNIRSYKAIAENYEILYKKSPSKDLKRLVEKYKSHVLSWEIEADLLVDEANKNTEKWLRRDKRKETRNIILKDMDVDMPKKDDNVPPTPTPEPKEKPNKNIEIEQIEPNTKHKIINAKPIRNNWKNQFKKEFGISVDEYCQKEHKQPINCVIHLQEFDKLPKVLGKEEFNKAVKESQFIGKRTISAETMELARSYSDMLKNGEFYVDCKEGGSSYGKGCYLAGSFDLDKRYKSTEESLKFVNQEMENYNSISDKSNKKNHIVTTVTLDPSAKLINYNDIQFEYGLYLAKKGQLNTSEEMLDKVQQFNDNKKNIDKLYQDNMFIARENYNLGQDKLLELTKPIREKINALEDKNRELRNIKDSKTELTVEDYYYNISGLSDEVEDAGEKAIILGYDGINVSDVSSGGITGNYVVALNRTKLIILEDDEEIKDEN